MPYTYYQIITKPPFILGLQEILKKRIWEHKNKVIDGFTKKYNLNKLIYYELTKNVESAINREKQLKRWHRQWKIDLIKKMNPEFNDLYDSL